MVTTTELTEVLSCIGLIGQNIPIQIVNGNSQKVLCCTKIIIENPWTKPRLLLIAESF